MAPDAIVFALANPTPEVDPSVAHRHAAVVATGRSDYPNQINNVLAFPGVFAGAFDAGAGAITEGMKLAAASALGDVVADELRPDRIVPDPVRSRGWHRPWRRRSPRRPRWTASRRCRRCRSCRRLRRRPADAPPRAGFRPSGRGRATPRPGGATAVRSRSGGSENGTRRKRSSVPSTPNRDPGTTMTPARPASMVSDVDSGASSSAQSEIPPCGSANCHSGNCVAKRRRNASRRSRSCSTRAGIRSSSRRTIWAATSWSSTAPPMSIEARSAASRCTRSVDARTQPVRRPPHTGLDNDPTMITDGVDGGRAAQPPAEPEFDERLVHDHGRAGLAGGAQHLAAGVLVDQRAGRVVEVGNQIGQPRRGLAQGGPHRGDVPAAAPRPSARRPPARPMRRMPSMAPG